MASPSSKRKVMSKYEIIKCVDDGNQANSIVWPYLIFIKYFRHNFEEKTVHAVILESHETFTHCSSPWETMFVISSKC